MQARVNWNSGIQISTQESASHNMYPRLSNPTLQRFEPATASSVRVHRRSAFTIVELLVVVAIIGVLIALLLPAVQQAREAARRTECKNNLRQIGISIHLHHDTHRRIPSGWNSDVPIGEPGWGWGAQLLPFMEQSNAHELIDYRLSIEDATHDFVREHTVSTFLCPTDGYPSPFLIGGVHDHDHEHGMAGFQDDDDHDHDDDDHGNVDEGPTLFPIARSNYVGMFGSTEIEDAPSQGNGVFYHNSKVRFADIVDGMSNTFMVGERSSRLGGSVWIGVLREANEPMARVVGSADHVPNSPVGHFEDFGSYHPTGANFLLSDGSVRLINDEISPYVYWAASTRHGHEAAVLDQY